MFHRRMILLRRADFDPTPAWLAGLLTLAIVVQVAIYQPAELPAAAAARVPLIVTAVPAQIAAYPEIAARPLFNPLRRSGAGADANGQAGVPAIGDFTLLGTARAAGDATALFRGPGNQIVNLHRGGGLAGWRIVAIAGDRAVLANGRQTRTVVVGAPLPLQSQAPVQ